jgi:hypothetical protein
MMSIKERFAKLIDVKSFMTIFLTIIFGVLTLCRVIPATQFVDIFKMIVIFYFGVQVAKKTTDTKGE